MKVLVCLIGLLPWISVCESFLLDERCPHCNWNGVCNTHSGKCACYDGFKGTDCSVDCGCQARGTCKADNTCQCDRGWKWSTSQHKCIWDCQCSNGASCMGPGVCGCTRACQYGTCWNGQCECWEGYKGRTCSVFDASLLMNRNVSVGMNIEGLSYWSPELKFVDVAKQSQEWITERIGVHTWDTREHDNVTWRSDGYPASLPKSMVVGKLVLRGSAGQHGPQGNFTILYDGDGELDFKLVKYTKHYNGKGRMVVEFHEKSGGIFIKIMRTNPSNPIHNIRVILPGFEDRHKLFPFYPPFLDNLKRFSELRFMDFMHTNAHMPEPTTWSTRRLTTFHTQTGDHGAAIEYAIQIANILGANPWFCQPHSADDDFVKQFARLAMKILRPELKVYLEYSNEVWNGIFRQTKYSQALGAVLHLDNQAYKAGMKYYNIRSAGVMQLWKQVFGAQANRLVPVWAWQTGYKDYTRQALEDLGSKISEFKAIAITGYFSCDRVTYKHNVTSLSVAQVSQLCKNEVPDQKATFKHYMDVAKYEKQNKMTDDYIRKITDDGHVTIRIAHLGTTSQSHNVKLLMYEGGPGLESSRSHDDNVTQQAIAFNRHSLMELAVNDDLESWYSTVDNDPYNSWPGGLFNYFTSVSTYSKYGSWGMLEYTGQDPYTSPKYLAMHKYINRHYNNGNYGPNCTFVSAPSGGYGCFTEATLRLRCGATLDRGFTWKYYPTMPGTPTAIVLDGYDVDSHVIYVRAVDSLAVSTFYTLDTKTEHPTWQKLDVFDYHARLAPFHVIRPMPQGVHTNINTNNLMCTL